MDIVEQPLVTTVIPTYRRPLLLRRAILSALLQSYPNILVQVCDNASDDETEEVVRRLAEKDPRVHYHRHPVNIGSYNNFNYGIRSVKTPFFSLLSDDDMLLPDFYKRSLEAFTSFPEAMFAGTAAMVVDINSNVLSEPLQVKEMILTAPAEGLMGPRLQPIPWAWTGILFRTRVRDEIGLIDTDAGPFADGAYVMHAAARFPFVDVPGVGAVLMAHRESTSGTVKPLDGEWLQWWDRMVRRIEEDPDVPHAARKRMHDKDVKDIAAFNLDQIAVKQALTAVASGNVEVAAKVVAGARECGLQRTARVLGFLVWIERLTGLARPLLALLRATRRAVHRHDASRLNRRYATEVAAVQKLQALAMSYERVARDERTEVSAIETSTMPRRMGI